MSDACDHLHVEDFEEGDRISLGGDKAVVTTVGSVDNIAPFIEYEYEDTEDDVLPAYTNRLMFPAVRKFSANGFLTKLDAEGDDE